MRKKFFYSLLLLLVISIFIVNPSKNGIKRLYYKFVMVTRPHEKVLDMSAKHILLKNNPISQNSIIFLGDSLINSFNWKDRLNNSGIRNLGINGLKISTLTDSGFIELLGKAKQIFILIGINDFWIKSPLKQIKSDTLSLVEKLNKYHLKNIHFISLLPVDHSYLNMRRKEIVLYNRFLERLSSKNKFKLIKLGHLLSEKSSILLKGEYTYDGIHLNKEGYAVIANELSKYLVK